MQDRSGPAALLREELPQLLWPHLAEGKRTAYRSFASLDFIKGFGSGQQTRLVQSLPLISSIEVSEWLKERILERAGSLQTIEKP